MNIPPEMLDDLRLNFEYNWDEPSILYLGVQISYPTSKLFEVNYPKLLIQIQDDVQIIQKKMFFMLNWKNIFAKIIYYF